MKDRKIIIAFSYKFWSISLGHFIKQKPPIFEKWFSTYFLLSEKSSKGISDSVQTKILHFLWFTNEISLNGKMEGDKWFSSD